MSGWYLAFDKPVPGVEPLPDVGGGREFDMLNALAERIGVPAFHDFLSKDMILDVLSEEEIAEQFGDHLPPTDWFAPEAGLATVRAIQAYLSAHPNEPATVTYPERVHPPRADYPRTVVTLPDVLGFMETTLAAAQGIGARFHVGIDI